MGASDNSGGASAPPLSPVRSRYGLERLGAGRVQLTVREETDVELAKALAANQREKEAAFGRRRNAEMVHVARLPTSVVKVIAQVHGIDLLNVLGRPDWTPPTQAEMRRLERIIETELPALKTTSQRFNLKPHSVSSA